MFLDEALFIDFLNAKELTWSGVDFSKAKFTKNGFDYPLDVILRLFNEWNFLIISDQKKYDIRLSFRKPVVNYNLSVVSKLNKTVKLNNLLTDFIHLPDLYSESDITSYVQTLDLPKDTPYNLLFIVESFDMNVKMAAIWVVIIYSKENKVILCEKFLKSPAGFGVRNYWARTFYNLLFDIRKYAFLRWENLIKSKFST